MSLPTMSDVTTMFKEAEMDQYGIPKFKVVLVQRFAEGWVNWKRRMTPMPRFRRYNLLLRYCGCEIVGGIMCVGKCVKGVYAHLT